MENAVQDAVPYQVFRDNHPEVPVTGTSPDNQEPDNQRTRLLDSPDQRAARLRDVFKENDAKSFALLIPVRKDFAHKKRGELILGCSTWAGHCKTVLGYSPSHIRAMLAKAGWTGAQKYTPKNPGGAPDAPLTDADYVRACVRLVKEALTPLESEPLRFTQVVRELASEIGRLEYDPAVNAGTALPHGEVN